MPRLNWRARAHDTPVYSVPDGLPLYSHTQLCHPRILGIALAGPTPHPSNSETEVVVGCLLAASRQSAQDHSADGRNSRCPSHDARFSPFTDPIHDKDYRLCDHCSHNRRWLVVRGCQLNNGERLDRHIQLLCFFCICILHSSSQRETAV